MKTKVNGYGNNVSVIFVLSLCNSRRHQKLFYSDNLKQVSISAVDEVKGSELDIFDFLSVSPDSSEGLKIIAEMSWPAWNDETFLGTPGNCVTIGGVHRQTEEDEEERRPHRGTVTGCLTEYNFLSQHTFYNTHQT